MTDTTTPTSLPKLWLTLQAHDAPALIDWLRDVLGFVETARYGDGDSVDHAELVLPDGSGGIMLGSYHEDRPFEITPGSGQAYLVADPDATYARAVAAGAEITRELADTDYGSREFGVRDPEGNTWSVGSYPGASA